MLPGCCCPPGCLLRPQEYEKRLLAKDQEFKLGLEAQERMRRDITRLKQEVAHWQEQAAAVKYLPAPDDGAPCLGRGAVGQAGALLGLQAAGQGVAQLQRSPAAHDPHHRQRLLRPAHPCPPVPAEELRAKHEADLAASRAEAAAKEAAARAEVARKEAELAAVQEAAAARVAEADVKLGELSQEVGGRCWAARG